MRSSNLAEITQEVVSWADEQLPDRTLPAMLLKLCEEVGAAVARPSNPLQLANVLILLVDIADKQDIDLSGAVHDQMAINRINRWHKNRLTGVMSHAEPGA